MYSVFWEQPERLEQVQRPLAERSGSWQVNQVAKVNQPRTNSSRSLRAALTPRGSLVSVTHTSKLVKIDRPNYQKQSVEENRVEKRIDRSTGREAGTVNGDRKENRTDSQNSQSNNGSSENGAQKPQRPPRRKTSELSARKNSESQRDFNRPRSVERRVNSDTPVKRSSRTPVLQSSRKSEPALVRQPSLNEKNGEKLSRRNSENEVLSARRTETFVRSTTVDVDERGDYKQVIQADVHPELTEKKRPFRGFFESIARKASLRKKNAGGVNRNPEVVAEVRQVLEEVPAKSTAPSDTVRVVVHSLYFVEGARILGDDRPGEIFVLFELLGQEHESPLAIVKPEVAEKELTFEFQKGNSAKILQ